VPIEGPSILCGDNESVFLNTAVPSSQLKKKHNAVAYHRVREAIAANIIRFVKVDTKDNYADCLTKPLAGPIFHSIVSPLLFRKPSSFVMKKTSTESLDEIEETASTIDQPTAVETRP
jgi:hypothetical protein